MNALFATLSACIASGAVFTSLCAALSVPVLAWFAVRVLAPAISRMDDDPRWQASLAASAAITPGLLFIAMVAYGLINGASSACLQTLPGRIFFGALAVLMLATIARSVILAMRRERDAGFIIAQAHPASPRLARIAGELRIAAYQIPDSEQPVVMLMGARHPGVYVSEGALEQLGDAELRAALYHELAHQHRGDHRIAPALYFFADLLPLRVSDLIEVYRRSREYCADERAVLRVERLDLASALLRIARPPIQAGAHTAAFAELDLVRGRLDALLKPRLAAPSRVRRFAIAAALSVVFGSAVAVPHVASLVVHCSRMSPMS